MAPKVLVGLNDVRHKIGTDVEFFVRSKQHIKDYILRVYLILCNFFLVNEEAIPCHVCWYHNEATVISTPRCLMSSDERMGEFRLMVRNLQITDDGSWAIEVTNDLGRAGDQCKLTLKGTYVLT